MKNLIAHYFLPQASNNHRAHFLNFKVIILLILFFSFSPIYSHNIKYASQKVLGESISITPDALLSLTNKDRKEKGFAPLKSSEELERAALKKAEDMLLKNYWSHNAPDGKTPWVFIKDAGYNYIYAGENLAKGFNSSKDIVEAWMESPEHRQNMLSPNFEDVGFAVKEGKIGDENTILVVEEFGGKTLVPIEGNGQEAVSSETNNEDRSNSILGNFNVASSLDIASTSFSAKLVLLTLTLFIAIFILDITFTRRKKITRIVGHNLDHILFLLILTILVINLARGVIL